MLQHATGSVKVLATRFSHWRSRSRVLAVAAASVLLAVGVFASPSPAAAVTTSITLKPTSGPPTTKVSVSGAGFGTSETVTVTDFGMSQSAVTSSTGTFTAGFTVPKTAQPGKYPVTATGQTSHLSATAYFLDRTNWPMFGFNAANTRDNPYENVLSTSKVAAGLTKAWQVDSSLNLAGNSSPTVYNGTVYIGSGQSGTNLDAFNASTGALLWRGGGARNGGTVFLSSPAVAGGVAYIASTDGNFYAYSTKTGSQCSGSPVTCQPLWTAPIGGIGTDGQSSPVVSGGMVYVSAGSELYAFSASGSSTYCSGSPKVCKPEWTAGTIDGLSSPAVNNGVVYVVGLQGSLDAFSASTGAPLWASQNLVPGDNYPESPTVVGGVVYVGLGGNFYAFQCAGSPVTCAQKWSAPINTIGSGAAVMPAVANGVVYVQSSDSDLYAFSASTGTLRWSAPRDGSNSSPAVADGVVYISFNGSVYAFSAAGTTDCTGISPNKTCNPLWIGANGGSDVSSYGSPVVADGMVYDAQFNGPPLTAFKP